MREARVGGSRVSRRGESVWNEVRARPWTMRISGRRSLRTLCGTCGKSQAGSLVLATPGKKPRGGLKDKRCGPLAPRETEILSACVDENHESKARCVCPPSTPKERKQGLSHTRGLYNKHLSFLFCYIYTGIQGGWVWHFIITAKNSIVQIYRLRLRNLKG